MQRLVGGDPVKALRQASRVSVSFNPGAGSANAFRVRRRLYITLPATPAQVLGDPARYAAEVGEAISSPGEGLGLGLVESVAATLLIMAAALAAPRVGEALSVALVVAALAASLLSALRGKQRGRAASPGWAAQLEAWLASVARAAGSCASEECVGTLLSLGRVYVYRVVRSGGEVRVHLSARA